MPAVDWKAAIRYAQLVTIAYSVAPDANYTDATIAAISQAGYTFIDALYGDELAIPAKPLPTDTWLGQAVEK